MKNRICKRITRIFSLFLSFAILSAVTFNNTVLATTTNLLQVNSTSGHQIFTPNESNGGTPYFYGPSIIINSDNSIDVWASGAGSNGAWDYIYYKRSTDGGNTWSIITSVLRPTPGSEDAYSCCDPGVIKLGSYYYIGYTSTQNPAGTQNNVYLARSTSPTGPWYKWNGTGWGGNPTAVIRWTGTNGNDYGYGEPSLVLKDGTLYFYCTDSSTNGEWLQLFTCADVTVNDWPNQLIDIGRVLCHNDGDSIDVKYVDSINRFIGISSAYRFGINATMSVFQSEDGINWERAPFKGVKVQQGAHNAGISGNSSGHIDTNMSNFIAYADQPDGYSWGNWPTYMNPITISTVTYGSAAVIGNVSSTANWDWNAPRLWDGNNLSAWSSTGHSTQNAVEYGFIDLGKSYNLDGITISSNGGTFPLDFAIQASDDASNWFYIPGQTYTNFPNPGSSTSTFTFTDKIHCRYVRVKATKLRADGYNNYYLQLAEITPTPSADQINYTPLPNYNNPYSLCDNNVTHTADQLTQSGTIAEKFTTATAFNALDICMPTWGTTGGAAIIKVYTWNTDYNTTIAGTPLGQELVLNITDNSWQRIFVDNLSAGTYLWTVTVAAQNKSGSPTLGVWRDTLSTLGTAYLNGSATTGDYECRYYSTTSSGPIVPSLQNAGFETPSTTTYIYSPTGAGWTFNGTAGIEHNGSAWGATNAPEGVQACFLQQSGSIQQTVYFSTSGTFKIDFKAARRSSQTQTIDVYIDSTKIGTFTPSSINFTDYITSSFTATSGNHTIKFVGTNANGDNTAFIDAVCLFSN